MVGLLTPVIIGIICIVIGISNSKGNIKSLHSYHRSRVREEDKLPFGKLVGLGMIIIGISLIINGALSFAGAFIENDIMIWVSRMKSCFMCDLHLSFDTRALQYDILK